MKEYKYKINGNEYTVAVGDINNNVADVKVNGVAYNVELMDQPKASKPVVKRVAAAAPAAAPVSILEAMKMGNEIHAGKDGVVKSITVAKEDSVLEGNSIMIIA